MEVVQSALLIVWGYLRLIQLTDIIDILAVAYLIYKGMNMLRSSSAAQVAKALLFIMAILWVAYLFNFSVISFILGKAMELGLLALVIVFQPEIRKFLERVGSSNLARLWIGRAAPLGEMETAIHETVLAYSQLAKDRVGALMVFERGNLLDVEIESGSVMDAAVASELVKNIFYPKAPLHDGAVIVRDGRIVGAGCMLPLSTNRNLSRELGMRHRAGIGVSEQSDAVVAIVSEETGAISVAIGGRLRRHLAPEMLQRVLRNELLPSQQEDEKPKTWLSRLLRRRGGSRE